LEDEYQAKMEILMNILEDYRSLCIRDGSGYVDAFKKKERGDRDFQANLKRLELAGRWDEIKNKFDKDELPDDFQCSEEWIRRGTHYRLLVEPLDIANYYRLGKNEDSGFYGRPSRYKTLQKWLEDNEENKQLQPPPTMLTQDSCLWAYVEENACLMDKNNYSDEKRTELENRVRPLIDSHGLCMEDFMTGESTFKMVVNWLWTHMSPAQQATSPFRSIIYYRPQTAQN
jgi:enhanced disease susceptibility 1 protein